jgi:hypothetical protein
MLAELEQWQVIAAISGNIKLRLLQSQCTEQVCQRRAFIHPGRVDFQQRRPAVRKFNPVQSRFAGKIRQLLGVLAESDDFAVLCSRSIKGEGLDFQVKMFAQRLAERGGPQCVQEVLSEKPEVQLRLGQHRRQ